MPRLWFGLSMLPRHPAVSALLAILLLSAVFRLQFLTYVEPLDFLALSGLTDPFADLMQWDLYEEMKNHTSLPIILKGITTVEDAKKAVEKGVPAIMLSNHGGRQVDYSPSPLEIAFEIHHNAPEVFKQIEVLADSGIRYGDDVVKLLALGVKAVGMGRP